jgi:hypothetical protein
MRTSYNEGMNPISSRTPEGVPNRCPLCGKELRIEPSRPTGDAPCPNCGQLLWFEPSSKVVSPRPRGSSLVYVAPVFAVVLVLLIVRLDLTEYLILASFALLLFGRILQTIGQWLGSRLAKIFGPG